MSISAAMRVVPRVVSHTWGIRIHNTDGTPFLQVRTYGTPGEAKQEADAYRRAYPRLTVTLVRVDSFEG